MRGLDSSESLASSSLHACAVLSAESHCSSLTPSARPGLSNIPLHARRALVTFAQKGGGEKNSCASLGKLFWGVKSPLSSCLLVFGAVCPASSVSRALSPISHINAGRMSPPGGLWGVGAAVGFWDHAALLVHATLLPLRVCVCVCSEQHHLGGESRWLPRMADWRRRSC